MSTNNNAHERRDAPADELLCVCGASWELHAGSDWELVAAPPAAAPAGEVQPVAWMCGDEVYRSQDEIPFGNLPPVNTLTPLYAAPPSAVVEQAVQALTRMCKNFPTDTDMAEAGWSMADINEACDAYDAGQAALASLRSLQQPKEQTR